MKELSIKAYEAVVSCCDDCSEVVKAALQLMEKHPEISDIIAVDAANKAAGETRNGFTAKELVGIIEDYRGGRVLSKEE